MRRTGPSAIAQYSDGKTFGHAPEIGASRNVIVLSEDFFQEIVAHPIPTDLEVVRLLAASPGALDLYLWLMYRSFTTKGIQQIPLFGPTGLQAQLGCAEYSRPRRFRAMLRQWIGTVRVLVPDRGTRIRLGSEYLTLDASDQMR